MKKPDLYLHATKAGAVWAATENQVAASTGLTTAQFPSGKLNHNRIYILGTKENATLILRLAAAIRAGTIRSQLFLGTPLTCPLREHSRPEIVLHKMPGLFQPASLGGWHQLTVYDEDAYALVQRVSDFREAGKTLRWSEAAGTLHTIVADFLPRHPLWPSLSFLPTSSSLAAVLLLADIIDPRWHCDPRNPDDTHRLIEYLGVKTQNLSYMLGSPVKRRELHRNDTLVLVMRTLFGDGPRPNPRLVQRDPRYFLWKIRDQERGTVKSLRKACRFGINFLRSAWAQALTIPGEQVFVPEYFFHDPAEAQAYIAHVARVKDGAAKVT